MMRAGHYLGGAVAGLAVAELAAWPAAVAVSAALVASAVAPLPDVDQRRWWATLRRFRPLQHRRLTHWWGLMTPVAALLPVVPESLQWLILAVLAGWSSHLIGDWVFGKRGPMSTGWRGAGIPLAPWWGYHGLGLDCGGRLERFVAWPVLGLTLAAEVVLMIGVR